MLQFDSMALLFVLIPPFPLPCWLIGLAEILSRASLPSVLFRGGMFLLPSHSTLRLSPHFVLRLTGSFIAPPGTSDEHLAIAEALSKTKVCVTMHFALCLIGLGICWRSQHPSPWKLRSFAFSVLLFLLIFYLFLLFYIWQFFGLSRCFVFVKISLSHLFAVPFIFHLG